MKKLYYLLIVLMGVCIGACSNDDGVDNSQPTPEVPEPDKITLSQQTIEVGFEPDTYAVNVTSPYSWDAVSKNDWIVVDSPTGIAGTKQLSFSIARNEEEKVREGTIVVKNSDFNLITELYITQGAFVPSELSVTPKTLNFSIAGGEKNITVTANFEHSATTDVDWLTITKTEDGYTITAPEYSEVDSRTAEVVISNEKYGISEVVNVTQSAFVPEISIAPKTLNFSAIGGEESIAVTANFTHTATTDADWLSITKTEKGYTIAAPEYLEVDSRTAEVVISNEKYSISEVVNITQSAFVPSELSVTPKTLNFSAVGNEESVAVTANFEHEATTDADWLTITKTEEGYIIKTSANPELEERTAEVVISNEKYNISETIQIAQEGPNEKQLIYYTSKNSSVVTPNNSSVFGANIISNIYKNGIGVIVFDGEVTTIGDYAFDCCRSLTSITIPDGVTTIGERAFNWCSSLTNVTIGDGVTSIGEYAFYGCTGELVVNCNIPSASNYWSGTFIGSDFTSVTIGDSVTEIGNYAFYNCDSLTSVTIPDSVTTIGEYAFADCSSLISVTIPDSVTTIGDYAFCDCSSLKNVTIGDCVATIGSSTFYNCSSLTSVTIPASVTTIGYAAFDDCDSLTSVYCKAITPPAGGWYVFDYNASGRKIYVPMESVNAYKSAEGWSDYADAIVGYNF